MPEKQAIVQKESAVLRQKAVEIPLAQIKSARISRIIKVMKAALDSQPDGVAIAAPQIGESLRMFVVSGRVFEFSEDVQERKNELPKVDAKKLGHLVFINPKIIKLSRQKEWLEEGCLSVRWLYGKVRRSLKATVQAYDEKGKFFERGASGLMAQVFQHEVDHLEGILFIDKARALREMPPEEEPAV